MIIEYCPHGCLQNYIDKRGVLAGKQLIKVTKQIAEALNYCHKAMIAHHDIKPGNILIDVNNRVKIADFGISHKYTTHLSTCYSSSPYFTAPEICLKQVYNPFKADVWAFGVTLYYLSTGEYPFNGDSKPAIYKTIISGDFAIPVHVSNMINQIIRSCLNLNPSKRPTFEEILNNPIFRENEGGFIRASLSEFYPEIIVPFRRVAKNARNCIRKSTGKLC